MWDADAFEKVGINAKYNEIMLKLKDSGIYSDTEGMFSRLKAIYPDYMFESLRENSENMEMTRKTVLSVYVSVVVIIAVFGLLSVYVTEKTKLQEQKRIWGSLRAAGVERKQAYAYQIFAVSVYIVFAWIFALILSLLCVYGITDLFDFLPGAHLVWYTLISWPGAVGALLVFEAFGLGVSLPQMNGIFKKSIVGLISYE
jgi:ABC-type antimicrobial peptide transport system permease subunit